MTNCFSTNMLKFSIIVTIGRGFPNSAFNNLWCQLFTAWHTHLYPAGSISWTLCSADMSDRTNCVMLLREEEQQLTGKVSLQCCITAFKAPQLRSVTASRLIVLVQVLSLLSEAKMQHMNIFTNTVTKHKQDRFGSVKRNQL